MSHKNNFDDVKKIIENNNHQLLSNYYENAKTKLTIKCDHNHIFEMKWNNFQQGQRCPLCNNLNKNLSKKCIKNYIQQHNYTLVSENYINNESPLSLKCDKGHFFNTTFRRFKQGKQRCPYCAGNVKHDFIDIKKRIEFENYKLLSTEYKDANGKLKMMCNNEHIIFLSYSGFKQGQRCNICQWKQKSSKPEKEIVNFIKTIYNGNIVENDRTVIKNSLTGRMLELDVWFPDLNKAIEFNGDYWHSKENVKQRDVEKIIQCKEKNIDLLIINEKEWKQNKNWNFINRFILK